jgi:hypothetical protein
MDTSILLLSRRMPVRVTAIVTVALLAGALAAGCGAQPEGSEDVDTLDAPITAQSTIARAEEWVSARLHYCQSPNHARDFDAACSAICERTDNAAWNPYRSDCSGLVSWAWGLPAPGRVTGEFAPFQKMTFTAIRYDAVTSGGSPPPPPAGTACTVESVAGVCIATTSCAKMAGHVSTPGFCPGPASIECCTEPVGCKVGSVAGICIETSVCATMTGHHATPGHCPGPASEQCCTP